MSKLEAVLFDFDGTLADTNELISESYLHVLNNYFPGRFNTESVRPFNGPSLFEVFSSLLPEKAELMVSEYRAFNQQMHDELIRPFPEVKESLAQLKEEKVKLAVVSTKKNVVLRRGLDLLELTPYFDTILGSDDYKKVKPDPEPLEVAMARLGVKSDQCVMVGDNWQDIQGAHNADVTSVFVKWSQKTEEEMAPYKPNKIAQSMGELTEWLLSKN